MKIRPLLNTITNVLIVTALMALGIGSGQMMLLGSNIFNSSPLETSLDNFFRLGSSLVWGNFISGLIIWIAIAGVVFLIAKRNRINLFSQDRLSSPSGFPDNKRTVPVFIYILMVILVFVSSGLLFYMKWAKQNWAYSPYLFLLGIILMALVFYLVDRQQGKALLNINIKDSVPLLILVLVSLAVLGFNLRYPREMVADESAPWETVRSILQNKYQQDMFSYGYYSYPVMNAYIQAGLIRFFRLEYLGIVGWRATGVIIGLMIIAVTYVFVRSMYSKRVALAAAFMLLANPYFLILNRISFPTNQSILFPLIAVFMLYKAWQRDSLFYLSLAGIFSGLGFYVYPPGKIAILIGMMFLTVVLWSRTIRQKLICGLVYLFPFAMVVLPLMGESLFMNPDSAVNKLYETNILNVAFLRYVYPEVPESTLTQYYPLVSKLNYTLYFHPLAIKLFVRNAIVTFISFFHPAPIYNLNFKSSLVGSEWGFFTFLGLLLIFADLFRKGFRVRSGLVLLPISVSIIILGGILGAAQFWRIEPILPFLAICSSYGLMVLVDIWGKSIGKKWSYTILAGILLIGCSIGIYKYFTVIHIPPPEAHWEDIDLANSVNDALPDERIILVYDPVIGIKYGGGMIYDNLRPGEAKFAAIPIHELRSYLGKIDNRKKYTFFFDAKLLWEINEIFAALTNRRQMVSVRSETTGQILYQKIIMPRLIR